MATGIVEAIESGVI